MSPIQTLRAWLGLDREASSREPAPLRELVETLEGIDVERARHLARFAYLLGRVAHADRHVTPAETAAMEALVREEGRLTEEQAGIVVKLAQSSNVLFGGTADFQVAQEFAESASYDEKLALARCLFSVASSDERITMAEETEIHRITNQLRVLPEDLTRLRLEHRRFLPGVRDPDTS